MKSRFIINVNFLFSISVLSALYSCGNEDGSVAKVNPIAYAGGDLIVMLPTATAELNGSMSTDSDGTIESYQWEKISGSGSVSISDPAGMSTSIANLEEGVYNFRLTVTDNDNLMSKDSVTVNVVSTDELYFQGNMENVTISTINDEIEFEGWDELKNHEYVYSFGISNIGAIPFAFQEIVPDPADAGIKTLHAVILNDDPDVSGTTRAQASLRFADGVDLQVYHTSHRIRLSPDIAHFENYGSSIVWFAIVEIWNKHVDEWTGDNSGSARWNLSILKETGVGKPLYWRAKAEYMQPERADLWREYNRDVPVPIGEWFTLDVYMKRGEGENGKFKITITPDGGSPEVIFDISNSTMYPGHPEIPLYSWQPFKLYLDDTYLDWMSEQGKVVSAWYNDFKWYKN